MRVHNLEQKVSATSRVAEPAADRRFVRSEAARVHATGPRVAQIDGLRAIAMTLVVAQHCRLDPSGWTGVWLFYVISGFVICRNLAAEGLLDRAVIYKQFLFRRFFRIVPLYAVYLLIGAVILVASGHRDGLDDLIFLISFAYNWQLIFQIMPVPDAWPAFAHLWTLSVEEQFYLLFPLLLLFLPRRRFLAVAAVFVAAGPLIRWLYVRLLLQPFGVDAPEASAFAVYAASITQFDAFLMGALLALLEMPLRASARLRQLLFVSAAGAVAVYVSVYAWINLTVGARGIDVSRNILSGIMYGQGREIWVYSTVDLACASLLTLALTSSGVARLLATPWVAYVGRISYGGYVWHAFVLWAFVTFLMPMDFAALPIIHRIPWFISAWVATVGLASMSFHGFEQPIIRWSRSPKVRLATGPALDGQPGRPPRRMPSA